MNERSATIDTSLKHAADIEAKLAKTNEETKELVADAKKQGMAILHQAQADADKKRAEMLAKAKKEVEKVIVDAKEQIRIEKETALLEARDELAQMVAVGVGKVLHKSVDETADRKYIKDQIKRIS